MSWQGAIAMRSAFEFGKKVRLAIVVGSAMCCGTALGQTVAFSSGVVTSGLGSAAGVGVSPIGDVYVSDGANGQLAYVQGGNGSPTVLAPSYVTPGQVAVDASRNVYVANGSSNQVLEYPYGPTSIGANGFLQLNASIPLGSGLGKVVGVAVDLSGNVYVVDAGNKQLVEITAKGVQTVLKTGFTAPKQVAVDRLGNVYVADAGANAVVMLPVGGGASTTVGSGLSAPQGVATDPLNNLYVADTGNNRIVEVPFISGAPVTGSQTVAVASVTTPVSIAIDTRACLYVASAGSVYRFSQGGNLAASTVPVTGGIYFGLLPVGTTSQVFPVTMTFGASVSPSTIKVVTTGLTGYDYSDAGGDSCVAGSTYAAGSSCTVNVTFKPTAVGPRYGAVVFYNSTNQIISTTYLGGGGLGAVLNIDPGVLTSVTPVVPVGSTGLTLSSPRGLTTDVAGNIFLADNGNSRVVVLPAGSAQTGAGTATVVVNTMKPGLTTGYGPNDVFLDGAGNMITADGSSSVWMIPYENGNWNAADTSLVLTGYTKTRQAVADVAGNVFVCDNTGGVTYQLAQGATPGGKGVVVPIYGSGGCIGVAVDLFGNIGVTDYNASTAYYVPATGAPSYPIGSGLNNPWGITFDASGSAWIASYSASASIRVPNQSGVLTNAASAIYPLTVGSGKSFGVWVDPAGNYYYTSTSNNYTHYLFVNRSASTLALASTAEKSASVSKQLQVTSSGTTAPVFTGSGLNFLYDANDFGVVAPTPTAALPYAQCNFGTGLPAGLGCTLAFDFTPQSTGARNATVVPAATNLVAGFTINLTGTGTGAAPAGTATLALALAAPAGTPAPGQSLTVSGTVGGSISGTVPTGFVTFTVDGVVTATNALSSGGVASLTLPGGLALGTHSVTATYSGDSNYPTSTAPSTLTVTVALATPTVTLTTYGTQIDAMQSETLTGSIAQISGLPVPTGTLTFLDGTTTLGSTTLASGLNLASISTTSLALGTHTITVQYSGDGDYMSGTSNSVTVTVGTYTLDTVTLAVLPGQPAGGYVYGTQLTATAVVTASSGTKTPTGVANFILDGQPTAVALSGTSASEKLTPVAGTHSLIVAYSGDPNFTSSASTTYSFVVNKAATTTTLSASSTAIFAGFPVTLTVNVSSSTSTPIGSVTFFNGNNTLGTATLSGGTATLTTSLLPAGNEAITVSFGGTSNFAPSVSAQITIVVTKQPVTLSLATTSYVISQTDPSGPTITGTVSGNGVPTGNLVFTLTSPSGAVTTFTPALNPVAQGTLLPNIGTSGNFTSGLYTVTISYPGDADFFASSATASLSFYVAPLTGYAGDFSGTLTPNPLTIPIGTTGVATLTLTPLQNYFGNISLSCSGMPLYTTCNISPNTVLLNGSGSSVVSTVNIVTQQQQVRLLTPGDRRGAVTELCGLLGGGLLLTLIAGSFGRGRRLLRSIGPMGLLTMIVLLAGGGSLTACGSHAPIATPTGTFTVNVTASGSGGIVHAIPMQVTFK